MKIGIIGAGQIGGTLTRRLTALGHEVFVANSRGATLEAASALLDTRSCQPKLLSVGASPVRKTS
jgi:8-hydroxy-5-deazaflavin:NADPH oxidoreductase